MLKTTTSRRENISLSSLLPVRCSASRILRGAREQRADRPSDAFQMAGLRCCLEWDQTGTSGLESQLFNGWIRDQSDAVNPPVKKARRGWALNNFTVKAGCGTMTVPCEANGNPGQSGAAAPGKSRAECFTAEPMTRAKARRCDPRHAGGLPARRRDCKKTLCSGRLRCRHIGRKEETE